MTYDDRNRGQVWRNDKKETATHPDFKGSVNVEGVEYWVSAWKRKPDANSKAPALSFSLQKKEAEGGSQGGDTGASGGTAEDELADPIPV